MEIEGIRPISQRKLFSLLSKAEREEREEQLLKELDTLPEAKYAEGVSERLNYYLENKKVDTDVYYESKYKPLDNDGGAASSEEAYQKLMQIARVQEYGSNFDQRVYDPQAVVQSNDELIDGILKKSVNKSFSSLINRPPSSQSQLAQNVQIGVQIPGRFPGFPTTMKTFIPFPPKP